MTEQHIKDLEKVNKDQEEEAVIFDIQRFSLQDGPGIRTTVFFKGCPLHCIWCHNPESLKKTSQLMYHATMCVGCMQCVAACPNHAHLSKIVEGKMVHCIDWSKCSGCGECTKVCNYDALSLMGRKHTVKELYERICGDIPYFELKGSQQKGGITFSGGEPMLYYKFIRAFKKSYPDIHVAIETSGYAPTKHFEKLGDSVDLYLFDYKATQENKHMHLCGVSNELIKGNLAYLCAKGKQVILRCPLIPEINDDAVHLKGIADVLQKYPQIEKAQIMPYHTLGINKRNELGMNEQTWGQEAASEEQQNNWLEKLRAYGASNVEISK